MKNKQKFTIIFLSLFSISLFYLNGFIGIISLLFSLIFYGTILYFIYYSFKKIFNKKITIFDKNNYKVFGEKFLYRVSTSLTLFFILIGSFGYYQNYHSPALMPSYKLSNGDKEVIFQAMSHIGSNSFYEDVVKNITKAKENGYVLYFEGVRPGKTENIEKFNKALGIKFEPDLYENMGKLYGLTHQDNSKFLGLINDKDYNVDLNIDEIIEYYEEVIKSNKLDNNKDSEISSEGQIVDANKMIIEQLASLNEKQLKVLRFINKSIINLIVKNEKLQSTLMNNFGNQALFDIILEKRNEVLAGEIINSEDKKIITTYGLLHFKGVLNLLQQNDSNWKIEKVDYLYPIK